jgi:hypothetical protein
MKKEYKFLSVLMVFFFLSLLPHLAYACRAHLDRYGGYRLEKKGQYEEAAFYHRVGMDFYASMLQLWMGTVYDDRVDEICKQHDKYFSGSRYGRHEDRWDSIYNYWLFYMRDGAARNVDQAQLSAKQRARMEDRLRIYNEDIIDPYNGMGCDMNFVQEAWVLEQTGLFWHAAYRRELAGLYMVKICSQYCSAIAEEMELVFNDPTQAELYRQKAAWWRDQAMHELQRCNGDRALSRIKGVREKKLSREEVITILKKALHDSSIDARRSAVWLLSDMGELELLEGAMKDKEVEIRKAAANTFASKMYLPGLALAFQDAANGVSTISRSVLYAKPESAGTYLRAIYYLAQGLGNRQTKAFAIDHLKRLSGLDTDEEAKLYDWAQKTMEGICPGALFEYFAETDSAKPVATKVLDSIDVGVVEMPQFAKGWYEYLDKPTVIPPDAKGPFRLLVRAKLYIPADGNYRFYVKTPPQYRAKVYIEKDRAIKDEIVSPKYDSELQYAKHGGAHRIDFSATVLLQQGLKKLVIDYSGNNIQHEFNEWQKELEKYAVTRHVGIQLFWSSDTHLTELVSAEHLFHIEEKER